MAYFFFWDGMAKLDIMELDKLLSADGKKDAVWIGVENEDSILQFSGNTAWIVLSKQMYPEWGIFHEGLEHLTLLEYVIRGKSLEKNVVNYPIKCPTLKITFEMLQEGCYVLSRYGCYLQEICGFNSFAEELLRTARELDQETRLIPYMECMLSRNEEYWRIEIFDMKKRPWQELRMYQGKRFLAVVGFQTVLFSIHSKEDGYLLDL